MNLQNIKDLVTSKTARQILLTKKHSPQILFVAGAIGVVGATVLACRATLKMDDVLQDTDEAIQKAKTLHVDILGEEGSKNEIDLAVLNKELSKIKIRTGLEIVKLYAPAVGLGALSVLALTGSHVILTKRNTAVMAAYAAIDRGFKEYRQRVVEDHGQETDRKYATGVEDFMVEEKTADGKVKNKKDLKKIPGRFGGSPYAVVFDEISPKFSREPGRNRDTIMLTQNWANEKLRSKGHLLLNDVYDMLQLPRSKEGCVVGWVYLSDDQIQKKRAAGQFVGDNQVSFGVFDGDPAFVEAFMDGAEKYAVLDFNVDGVIYDKL